jgi:glutathione S-transferase
MCVTKARAPGLLMKLEKILEGKEYLVKNTFSVADVAVSLSLSLSLSLVRVRARALSLAPSLVFITCLSGTNTY